MNKIEKIEKLEKDLAWWQDKLNRSRKESLRSIRAVHVQHLQGEIQKLKESWEKIWLLAKTALNYVYD